MPNFTLEMKRISIFLLLLLYVTVSSGFTVHLHYCMGELVESRLTHSDEATCGGCGMEKDKSSSDGCCKDEHKLLKIDQNKKLAELDTSLKLPVSDQVILFAPVSTAVLPLQPEYLHPPTNAPPRQLAIPHYLLHRNFRI